MEMLIGSHAVVEAQNECRVGLCCTVRALSDQGAS